LRHNDVQKGQISAGKKGGNEHYKYFHVKKSGEMNIFQGIALLGSACSLSKATRKYFWRGIFTNSNVSRAEQTRLSN
jgi:hypothetical protein